MLLAQFCASHEVKSGQKTILVRERLTMVGLGKPCWRKAATIVGWYAVGGWRSLRGLFCLRVSTRNLDFWINRLGLWMRLPREMQERSSKYCGQS
jgi:hypothetical protein